VISPVASGRTTKMGENFLIDDKGGLMKQPEWTGVKKKRGESSDRKFTPAHD